MQGLFLRFRTTIGVSSVALLLCLFVWMLLPHLKGPAMYVAFGDDVEEVDVERRVSGHESSRADGGAVPKPRLSAAAKPPVRAAGLVVALLLLHLLLLLLLLRLLPTLQLLPLVLVLVLALALLLVDGGIVNDRAADGKMRPQEGWDEYWRLQYANEYEPRLAELEQRCHEYETLLRAVEEARDASCAAARTADAGTQTALTAAHIEAASEVLEDLEPQKQPTPRLALGRPRLLFSLPELEHAVRTSPSALPLSALRFSEDPPAEAFSCQPPMEHGACTVAGSESASHAYVGPSRPFAVTPRICQPLACYYRPSQPPLASRTTLASPTAVPRLSMGASAGGAASERSLLSARGPRPESGRAKQLSARRLERSSCRVSERAGRTSPGASRPDPQESQHL